MGCQLKEKEGQDFITDTHKMSKKRNTRITDKPGFRYTCYVATATKNLTESHNSSLWTGWHIMDKLGSQNKNDDFWWSLAWHSRFKNGKSDSATCSCQTRPVTGEKHGPLVISAVLPGAYLNKAVYYQHIKQWLIQRKGGGEKGP